MDGWLAHMPGKNTCYTLGVRCRVFGDLAGPGSAHVLHSCLFLPACSALHLWILPTAGVLTASLCLSPPSPLQPRSFLELGTYIMSLDLPPATQQALEAVLA